MGGKKHAKNMKDSNSESPVQCLQYTIQFQVTVSFVVTSFECISEPEQCNIMTSFLEKRAQLLIMS